MRSDRLGVVAAAALVALAAGVAPQGLPAQTPTRLAIAAASDLQSVLPGVVRGFERARQASVAVSYGSSGTFFAQIQNGAPFDVFLSADVDYPRQLIAAGLADASTLRVYATGHLVVWARRDSRVDVSRGLPSLTDPRIRHVAIANPKFAPYGRAAVSALQSAGVYDALRPRLVMGDNIAQTAQLVQSGNADAGVLSLSLVLSQTLEAEGTYAAIPASTHPPIDQAAVVVKASRASGLARDFVTYLRQPDAMTQFTRFGFTVPPAR